MRMLIVLGDKHSGGGSVLTGSSGSDIDGKPIARIGDQAICPAHKGVFPIVTGDASLIVDGKAVARHGDKLACGCSLISGQQSRALIEAGGSAGSASIVPAASEVLQASRREADPDKPEVCEECLLAAARSATAFLGR